MALRAQAMAEERERTRLAGLDHHLTKPIEAETLIRRLAEITRR